MLCPKNGKKKCEVDAVVVATFKDLGDNVGILNIEEVLNAISKVEEQGLEPVRVRVDIKCPRDIRVYGLPVYFNIIEDGGNYILVGGKGVEKCVPDNGLMGPESRGQSVEFKNTKVDALTKAVEQLNDIELMLNKLLIKIVGDSPSPKECEPVQSFVGASLSCVLDAIPEHIINQIKNMSGIINEINKVLFG